MMGRWTATICAVMAVMVMQLRSATADPHAADDVTAATATQSEMRTMNAEAASLPKPGRKATAPAKPIVTLQAKADLTRQTLTVIEADKIVATWPISSGVEDHATPRGTFQPEWTAKMWYSRKYDNAPMPNAVFFKDGAAIHATQSVGALGRVASHGCVRLSPANAEAFYRMVTRHGLAHTRISVFGTPKFERPVVARHNGTDRGRMAIQQAQPTGWGSLFGSLSAENGNGVSSSGYAAARYPLSVSRYR